MKFSDDELTEKAIKELQEWFKPFKKMGVSNEVILLAMAATMEQCPPPLPKTVMLLIVKDILEKDDLK